MVNMQAGLLSGLTKSLRRRVLVLLSGDTAPARIAPFFVIASGNEAI
jgi:hypothetical protein